MRNKNSMWEPLFDVEIEGTPWFIRVQCREDTFEDENGILYSFGIVRDAYYPNGSKRPDRWMMKHLPINNEHAESRDWSIVEDCLFDGDSFPKTFLRLSKNGHLYSIGFYRTEFNSHGSPTRERSNPWIQVRISENGADWRFNAMTSALEEMKKIAGRHCMPTPGLFKSIIQSLKVACSQAENHFGEDISEEAISGDTAA